MSIYDKIEWQAYPVIIIDFIAGEVIKAKRLVGAVISAEKAEAIADLLAFVPATIKERTRATLYQAKQRGTALQTVLPVSDAANSTEQEAFYRSF